MKLENVDYRDVAKLSKSRGRRDDLREVLNAFLDSDNYAMKIIFGKEDERVMLEWVSMFGKTPHDYYLSVYNSYAAIISDNQHYKSKIQIKRFTEDKDSKFPMSIYLIRRDKTLTVGDDCQRRGYV